MLSCDYNGWNDAPEEEREWFDQHPEIWGATTPEPAARRAARRVPPQVHRRGMAS